MFGVSRQIFLRLTLTLALALVASAAHANTGSLWVMWDPNPEPDVTGYVVLWGTAPGAYTQSLNVGARTSVRLINLQPQRRYYVTVRAYTPHAQGALAAEVSQVVALDANGNGIPDSWEALYGLRSLSSAGGGASGDPDGDGLSNAEEYRRGTHPRGTEVQYLAEGVQSPAFWDTQLALLNPGTTTATVVVVFERADGRLVPYPLVLKGRSRVTVRAAAVPELQDVAFATRVESDAPLVVDRTVSWDRQTSYGAHAETGVPRPAERWYITEGATAPFSLFYMIENSQEDAARVRVTYLRESGGPVRRLYQVAPHSRMTIFVNGEDKRLAANRLSAVIESLNGVPIIAERAMYLDVPGRPWAAGSASAGVTSPSPHWLFAEGAANDWFDLFYLFANPNDQAITVRGTYYLQSGEQVQRAYRLAPNQRLTVHVNADPRLANAAASARFITADGQPFLAERTMWWPRQGWYESHTSGRITAAGTRWAMADGESGGRLGKATYVLAANTTASDAAVRITIMFEGGGQVSRSRVVPATSRVSWQMATEFPEAAGRRYGILVESLAGVPLVVERAAYWNGGAILGAGTTAAAVRLQ